jgi:RNA polymerase sigma-70 factor (ECF subfamily)
MTPEPMTVSIEDELRRAWDARAFDHVATRALEAYGPEIIGVLTVQLRSLSDALEAYSMFAEDLWCGLPGFQWRCSLRAWAHRLARNAAIRWAKAGPRRPERNVPLSDVAEVSAVAVQVRPRTEVHLRTEVKSALRDLREELPDDDRTLLVLRVDKRLEWREIAVVMSDAELSDVELKREAARLRKRYQLVTERLRSLARARGLLGDDGA